MRDIRNSKFLDKTLGDYAIITSTPSGWQNGRSYYEFALHTQLRSVCQGRPSVLCVDGAKSHHCTCTRKDKTVEHLCKDKNGVGVPVQEWLLQELNCYSWFWEANYSRLSPQDRPGTNLLWRHRCDLEMRSLMATL